MERVRNKFVKIIKRIALSLLCGIVFFFVYRLLISIIINSLHPQSPDFYFWLYLPISFTIEGYFYFFKSSDKEWFLNHAVFSLMLFSGVAIILYSLAIYMFLILISKFRSSKQKLIAPPSPPKMFD